MLIGWGYLRTFGRLQYLLAGYYSKLFFILTLKQLRWFLIIRLPAETFLTFSYKQLMAVSITSDRFLWTTISRYAWKSRYSIYRFWKDFSNRFCVENRREFPLEALGTHQIPSRTIQKPLRTNKSLRGFIISTFLKAIFMASSRRLRVGGELYDRY